MLIHPKTENFAYERLLLPELKNKKTGLAFPLLRAAVSVYTVWLREDSEKLVGEISAEAEAQRVVVKMLMRSRVKNNRFIIIPSFCNILLYPSRRHAG